MSRLPNPGADGDQWGNVLNDYLQVAHNPDGTLKSTGGGILSNPMSAPDDLIIGGASGATTRLSKGNDNDVLTVDPVTHHLAWSPGIADPTANPGDMLYRDGLGNLAALVVGSNGQVLGVVSGIPAWVAGGLPTSGGEVTGHLLLTAADNGILEVRKTTGLDYFAINSNAPQASWANGIPQVGYSDNFGTEQYRIDAATGEFTGVMAPQRLKAANVAGVTVANTTTETTLVSFTVPANTMRAGCVYKCRVFGQASWKATSGTITFRIKVGATAIATLTFPSQGSAFSNVPIVVEGELTIRTTGSGGTMAGGGFFNWIGGAFQVDSNLSAAVNTTTNQTIAVTAQWQTANASNTLTAATGTIEREG